MQIVMFDRQSIFIHGMKISLQHRIPGVSIQGASQADELWQKLESYPEALVMLDGDQDGEFCYWLLQKTVVQFPEVKVLITAIATNGGYRKLFILMCWPLCLVIQPSRHLRWR